MAAVLFGSLASSCGIARGAPTGVPIFPTLRSSLAIVAAPEGKGVALGTAFCIQSDRKHSYFLTNAHVVVGDDTVGLRLELDHKVYRATVIRRSVPPLDAAVIEVDAGNVPTLALSSSRPQPGTLIAIAGYPSIQLDTDFDPSVHEGIINDIIAGFYLEHDAETDKGNSGGPLFDPQTGVVYGIVTAFVPSSTARAVQNNIAIAIDEAEPFLANAGVAPRIVAPDTVANAQPAPSAPVASPTPLRTPRPPAPAESTAPAKSTAPAETAAPAESAAPAPTEPGRLPQVAQNPAADALQERCLTAFKAKTYERAIEVCGEYVLALGPAVVALKADRSPARVLPTTQSMFEATFLLSLSYAGLGHLTQGRKHALDCVGWGIYTLGELAETDPHYSSAGDRSLHDEIDEGLAAIEKAYPGSVSAESNLLRAAGEKR